MSELRITDTNSANDSKGRAFGLEGNNFIFVLIAFVASLAIYLVFAFVLHTGVATALLFSLPLVGGTLAWVLLLRHQKPDGYAEDVFDDLVNGEGWSLSNGAHPAPPREEPYAQ
jgi:hypothetical protein